MIGGPRYEAGSIIRFTYLSDDTSTDRYKEVLVLHPNWRGKMHALDLKRMTPAQVKVVEAMFNPATNRDSHPYPLVRDILRRMDPIEEIKNPISFYQKFCKPFLRTAGDVYRTYYPAKMSGVTVVKKSHVEGRVINPKPLFRKV